MAAFYFEFVSFQRDRMVVVVDSIVNLAMSLDTIDAWSCWLDIVESVIELRVRWL